MKFKKYFFVCVISASQNAKFILDNIKMKNIFSLTIDGHYFKSGDSKKDLFSYFLKINNFNNYVIFEDSIEVLWEAKQLGFITCGINTIKTPWLDYHYSDLTKVKPELLIQKLKF